MNTELARRQMVDQQIRTSAVTDERVLGIFRRLSRNDFVPRRYRRLAFADCTIPLGHGQFTMMPSVEGRLIQALEIKATDRVLEVGTGSGFLTACLAQLAAQVISIDIHEDFISGASARLAEHGIDNAELAVMDACADLPEGPFDAVAVTGSLPLLDQRFIDALKPGGRLFIVTGEPPVMEAQLIERRDETGWRTTSLFETSLGRLQNARKPTEFSF